MTNKLFLDYVINAGNTVKLHIGQTKMIIVPENVYNNTITSKTTIIYITIDENQYSVKPFLFILFSASLEGIERYLKFPEDIPKALATIKYCNTNCNQSKNSLIESFKEYVFTAINGYLELIHALKTDIINSNDNCKTLLYSLCLELDQIPERPQSAFYKRSVDETFINNTILKLIKVTQPQFLKIKGFSTECLYVLNSLYSEEHSEFSVFMNGFF